MSTSRDAWGKSHSPFHAGEREIQSRLGVRDTMETFGRRVIRPFMPDQHREFYAQLPFVAVGSVDADGWPWASLVAGRPGFLSSPDSEHLLLDAAIAPGDPLLGSLRQGAAVGLLGLDLATRRRNRVNLRVETAEGTRFGLRVDQSYGNCPQYIQTRTLEMVREPSDFSEVTAEQLEVLSKEDQEWIEGADTFFVSSFIPQGAESDLEGVDVSHRGGRPGFVRVDGSTLTIPDFAGNLHFNTLGNFLVNPKAGLLFLDFARGDVLMLTGTTEVLWEDHPEVRAFEGAERAWRFEVRRGIRLRGVLPLRWTFDDWSPNTSITGTWEEAAATLEAERRREEWRPLRVIRVEDESEVARSFYLEPSDSAGLAPYRAGQHLPIRVTLPGDTGPTIRTYTLSSAPGDPHYRITVKREPDGRVSSHLHERLKAGEVLEAKAPRGEFWMDASERRPALLLGAGIGITPMMSMARHAMREGLRTRHFRPVTVLHSARNQAERAFAGAFRQLERASDGAVRYLTLQSVSEPGVDVFGRLDANVLRRTLALDDYDVFLCGPAPYMQASYEALREVGVRDQRIYAEAFGPSSLIRTPDEGAAASEPEAPEAVEALVRFDASAFEQRWSKNDGTLLELAESHGLSPAYGCRSGSCGSCAVRLKEGSVSYRTPATASRAEDEVLICCAVPAESSDTVVLDL